MVLEVAGSTEQTSIIPVEHEGGRYLVADRADATWVERIRLSGRGSLTNKDRKMAVTATEVPVEDRAAIITAYRARAGEAAEAAAWADERRPGRPSGVQARPRLRRRPWWWLRLVGRGGPTGAWVPVTPWRYLRILTLRGGHDPEE